MVKLVRGGTAWLYEQVLVDILAYMLRNERNYRSVKQLLDRALDQAKKPPSLQSNFRGEESRVMGAAMDDWFRNREYLGRNTLPTPLRLVGPRPSVAGIIRSQSLKVDAEKVAHDMADFGLLRRVSKNRFVPANRQVTIRRLAPQLVDYVSRSCVRLLATVNENVTGPRNRVSLIERTSMVEDLPKSEIPAFRRFTERHGAMFLAITDQWLESRRATKHVKRSRKQVATAGVHVYAFEDAPKPSLRRRSGTMRKRHL
jgi:hypothetical protein